MTGQAGRYHECREKLMEFRRQLLAEMVAGRLKALIEAGRDTLRKYGELLDRTAVSAYLMGRLDDKMAVLTVDGVDLGPGWLARPKVQWTGPTSVYPLEGMGGEAAVPGRQLPQVDIFRYTPIADIELFEEAGVDQYRTFFLAQLKSGQVQDTPDIENAVYDWFQLYPAWSIKGEWSVVNPRYEGVETLEGTVTQLRRHVLVDVDNWQPIWLAVFTEAGLYGAGKVVHPFLVAVSQCYVTPSGTTYVTPSLNYTLCCIGHRVPAGETFIREWSDVADWRGGWLIVAESLGDPVGSPEVTWEAHYRQIIQVNDPDKGTTNPPPGEYMWSAFGIQGLGYPVEAQPYTGYTFKHWLRDGVVYSTQASILVVADKPHTWTAVFE